MKSNPPQPMPPLRPMFEPPAGAAGAAGVWAAEPPLTAAGVSAAGAWAFAVLPTLATGA
ncbi:hypothetical protein D3C72_724060 [compost metagenome]